MGTNSKPVDSQIEPFPNAEHLRTIADVAALAAEVIANSVITDDLMSPVHSERDENRYAINEVLDKLESLFYVEPPGLQREIEQHRTKWKYSPLVKGFPNGWRHEVAFPLQSLWRSVAGLLIYFFEREPFDLGVWTWQAGEFKRPTMTNVERPPIPMGEFQADGRVRRMDDGLPTVWLSRLRQHADNLRAALPRDEKAKAADDNGKSVAGVGTNGEQQERFVWKVDGEFFVIRFDGEAGRFRKSLVGFQRYRQVLQSRSGRMKMARLLGADRDERVTNDINRSSDRSVDEEGLAAVSSQLQNLKAELDEARSAGDLDKVVDCEEKIKQIEDWLNKQTRPATGEDGERRRVARKLANPVDRMRTTILDSFQEARKKLIEGGMPNLAGHLEASVRSENDEIVYSQPGAVTWGFE